MFSRPSLRPVLPAINAAEKQNILIAIGKKEKDGRKGERATEKALSIAGNEKPKQARTSRSRSRKQAQKPQARHDLLVLYAIMQTEPSPGLQSARKFSVALTHQHFPLRTVLKLRNIILFTTQSLYVYSFIRYVSFFQFLSGYVLSFYLSRTSLSYHTKNLL